MFFSTSNWYLLLFLSLLSGGFLQITQPDLFLSSLKRIFLLIFTLIDLMHGCYAQRSVFLLLFLGSFSLQLLKFIRMLLRGDTIKLISVIVNIYVSVETFFGLPLGLDSGLIILVGVPLVILFEFIAPL